MLFFELSWEWWIGETGRTIPTGFWLFEVRNDMVLFLLRSWFVVGSSEEEVLEGHLTSSRVSRK